MPRSASHPSSAFLAPLLLLLLSLPALAQEPDESDEPVAPAPRPTTASPSTATAAPRPATVAPSTATAAPRPATVAPSTATAAPRPATGAPSTATAAPASPNANPPQTSPEAAKPSDTKDAKNRFHFSLGLSAAPYLLYDAGSTKKWYIGMAAMPEFRFAVAFTDNRRWRVFGSFRWSALSTSALLSETPTGIPAIKADDAEFMGVAGVSFVTSPEGSSGSTVSSSIAGASLGVGGGNAKTTQGDIISGFVVLASIDMDVVSFNF